MGTFGRRLLLAVDAKGYGGVDVVTQREWQEAIRRLLEEAAQVAGLDWEQWVTQVGGDSVFAVLPQGASEPGLVDPFMRQLESGLRTFNRNRRDEAWLRLRAAVHFGTASPAANGFEGRAPVEIGRLLDSRVLKAALAAAPEAHLALAVSATVFNDVIGEAYTTIRPQEFREVRVAEKEYAGRAWIRVPGYDAKSLDLGVAEPGAEGGPGGAEAAVMRPPSAPTAPGDTVVQVINGTVHAQGAVFGISK
ncbi:hypothetical protein ACF09Y_15735 [Streptomyces massasporeus]|uniref:hypothetical protein n=1 Tax=Streptomyces TaxID=1883 RepID=UPI001C8CB36C|nr:hypothetical protein [Streptomyces sp. WAC04114]MBX9365702.1 hypothetical protein [Streptomyces sp. WAC04114]